MGTFLSSLRLRLSGATIPMFGTCTSAYAFEAHSAFLTRVFPQSGASMTPSSIVAQFKNDPSVLPSFGSFAVDFARNCMTSYPQFKNDPSSWTARDQRTAIVSAKTDGSGHYVYSGGFKANKRAAELVGTYSAGLHFIHSFPAGGGYVIPPDLYLNAVNEGRTQKRFPKEVFDENAPAIRDYQTALYKANRSLKGEIVILGNNAVQIANHSIFEVNGVSMQVMNPITLANHVFREGHALWVSMNLPELKGVSAHIYAGHGKNDVSLKIMLGDRLNVASGVPTFNDVFTAGVVTYEQFQALLDKHGDAAYALATDPDVALSIDQLLVKKDPALLLDRKIFTCLDGLPPTDLMRLFNPYTPIACSKKFAAAMALTAADGECDIYDIDLDDLNQKLEATGFTTAEDLLALLKEYPRTELGEGLFDASGLPYAIDGYNEMLSMEHDAVDDVFHQAADAPLGTLIDDIIAEQAKKYLDQAVDWSAVEDSVRSTISSQVNALAEATTPFADGSSARSVADSFLTQDFQQGVHDALLAKLRDTLGPRSAEFPQMLATLPLFASASPAVRQMLSSYPLIDVVANHTFAAMTSADSNGSSYFGEQMLASVIEAKQAYYQDPQVKTEAQQQIADRVSKLGDVAVLDKQLSQTAAEIDAKKKTLADVSERLLDSPGDKGLESQQTQLEAEINAALDAQRQIEDQLAEANDLTQAGEEMKEDHLKSEQQDAEHKSEASGEPIFGGEGKALSHAAVKRVTPHPSLKAAAGSDLLSIQDLVTKMAGQSMTDAWDMACCYTEEQLNKVLSSLYANSKLVTKINLGTADAPYSVTYTIVDAPGVFSGLTMVITQTYIFHLNSPTLAFSSTSMATLGMPVAEAKVIAIDATLALLSPQPANASQLVNANAWYKLQANGSFAAATEEDVEKAINTTGDKSQDPAYDKIAQGFYLRAQASSLSSNPTFQNQVYQLKHIGFDASSALDSTGWILSAVVPIQAVTGDGTAKSGGEVITFQASGDAASIVLHFGTSAGSGTTFSLTQGAGGPPPALLTSAPDILDRIENFFAQQVTDIDYVLTTVQSNPTTSGDIHDIQLTPKSFCFNTQTQGSTGVLSIFIQTAESGNPPGGQNLMFQDANHQPFLPVSNTDNTTLIYSRGFMSRYYFVQGLLKNGFKTAANTGTDAMPIAFEGDYVTGNSIAITGISVSNYDSITVDAVPISDVTINFVINAGSNLVITTNLSKTTTIHLVWHDSPGPCGSGGERHTEDDGATIVVTLNKTIPLQWVESQGELSISAAIAARDFVVNVDSSVSDHCGSDTKENINNQIETQVAAALPAIAMPMQSLSSLAEVNLLFNGQSLFTLDQGAGVFAPQDIVLFGNINVKS
jgi:hypothetical protein